MALKISNNAYGTLASGISTTDTVVTLSAGNGARFPTFAVGDFGFATLVNSANTMEIVMITARSSDTLTVVRAQDNTTATAYLAGDRIEMRPCAAAMNEKLDATVAAATYATTASVNTGLAAKLDSATALTTYAKLAGGNTLSGAQKIQVQHSTIVALGTVSGSVNIDLSLGSTFTMTLAAATAITFSNSPPAGFDQTVYLKMTNAGTKPTFPAGTKTPGGVAASGTGLGLTASGKDLLAVWYDTEQAAYVVGAVWKDYK